MRHHARTPVILLLLGLAAGGPGAAPRPAQGGAASAREAPWTLVMQLPRDRRIRVERVGGTLRGRAESLVPRLREGRGGMASVRRVEAGAVSVESPRIRAMQPAGSMLVLTVWLPAKRRVRVVSTNRLPLTTDPGHLTFLNLQLVAEGELHARSPFAVVDDPGRTAVLFQ